MNATPAPTPPPPSPPEAILPSAGWKRRSFLGGLAAGGAFATMPHLWAKTPASKVARGTVFHSNNPEGRKQAGDPGIEGVRVSNGLDVTLTDEQGKWQLPLLDPRRTDFFLIKPSAWAPPVTADLLPLHYYLHQPEGSPTRQFPGVKPTGPLPDSIDFPLIPQEASERFRMLICGDPQPRDLREVDFIAQSTPSALREANGLLGITLGDVAFDDLSIYSALNRVFADTGIPWRHVVGNHDLNHDSPDDLTASETFRSIYGPTYYSFEQGNVHFVVLDNVRWTGPDPAQDRPRGGYRGGLGERQLQWLAADLRHVPPDKLVVLFMHIPLRAEEGEPAWGVTEDRKSLYQLLADRPHTLSFSAHRHYHRHDFIGADDGWARPEPHHHLIAGTLCGSWFRGRPDAFGVPHGTMSDGTPRGFLAADFDGNRCEIDGYRIIGGPSGKQMHVTLQEDRLTAAQAAGTEFHVNFYHGSERSTLRARCGEGDVWKTLERTLAPDPHFLALVEAEGKLELPWQSLPKKPDACSHLWKGRLPDGLGEGRHSLEILAEDGFGHTSREIRIFEIGV